MADLSTIADFKYEVLAIQGSNHGDDDLDRGLEGSDQENDIFVDEDEIENLVTVEEGGEEEEENESELNVAGISEEDSGTQADVEDVM